MVNAYTLTFAGFLMLGGRSADLLGRRRVFLVGTAMFALSSLGCALADSRDLLIAARAMQGLSGAVLSPATLSIITASFAEGRERNRGLAAWGAVGGLGASSGALLGGVLTQAFGWQAIFAVNVPLGIVVVALGARLIPATARAEGTRHFDLTGAVLVTASLVSLTYGIVRTDTLGWGAPGVIVPLIGGVVLLGGVRCWSRRGSRATRSCRCRSSGWAISGPRTRWCAAVRLAVPGLVLPDAVHAAGAPLRRDRGRARLPADDALDLRRRRRSRHESWPASVRAG